MMMIGSISNLKEYVMDGQDLRSYNVRFTADGQKYQMADLDIVQDYFAVKEIEDPQQRLNKIVQLLIKYSKFNEFCQRLQNLYTRNSNSPTLKRDVDALITTLKSNEQAYASG